MRQRDSEQAPVEVSKFKQLHGDLMQPNFGIMRGAELDPLRSSHGTARRQVLVTAVVLAAGTSLVTVPGRAAQLVAIDVRPLAEAYRASRLIGETVLNDENQRIGTVDDLLITPNNRVLFAVLSVGGFLGLNRHLVAVPFSSLTVDEKDHRLVLPGASRDALMKLVDFHYA